MRKNPGLRSPLDEALGEAYEDARDEASAETGLPPSLFPARPPFGYTEIVGASDRLARRRRVARSRESRGRRAHERCSVSRGAHASARHLRKPAPASTNTAALEALARLAPEDVKVLVYRDLAKLPPFNPDDDVEDGHKPEPVETLRALISASDTLILAVPEYAHGIPGALERARLAGGEQPSPASRPC